MSPAQAVKPPRLSVQVDERMKRRVQKLLRAERQDRPFVSFSDVLREVIDAGLRTKESPGTNDAPEAS